MEESENSTFLCLFVLSRPLVDWMMPTHIGENHLLNSVGQFKQYSHLETLSQTCPELMFNQISGRGFSGGSVVNILLSSRRWRFNPWVGKIPWRRKWQLTPVLLPGRSHRQRSLAGYSPWGHRRVRHDLVIKQQQSCSRLVPHDPAKLTRKINPQSARGKCCINWHYHQQSMRVPFPKMLTDMGYF